VTHAEETLSRLERVGAAFEAAVAATGLGRADALAQALRLVWPDAARVECQTSGVEGEFHAAWGDGGGAELRAAIGGDASDGFLAVRLHRAEEGEDAGLMLHCAREVGVLLERERLRAAQRRSQDLIELGELAGPVMHELNNLLNALSLRLAVLEQEGGGLAAGAFDRVRDRSAAAAALISRFQGHRKGRAAQRRPIDLSRLLRRTADQVGGLAAEGGAASVRALCDETDLHNLLIFVVRFSASLAPGPEGQVRASLGAADGWASLRLDAAGPPPQPGVDYFAPRDAAPPATGLELAACRSIVQRIGGRIRATAAGEGRVTILVELPAA
jgi:signal transduction histidine kinase